VPTLLLVGLSRNQQESGKGAALLFWRWQGNKRSEQLTTLLHKHLLRRTKDTTIRDQLPRKVDNIVLCRLSKMQLRAYQRVRASLRSDKTCDTICLICVCVCACVCVCVCV
jgi:SNF2 family DNA or RNA helicase